MSSKTPRRVQLRPARDQLPVRRGPRAADQHVIYRTPPRRWPPRTARRSPSGQFNERRATRATCTVTAGTDGSIVFDEEEGLFDHFLAGMLAGLREMTLFLAPNINSYKRYAALSSRPDSGVGSRHPHLRVARRRAPARPAHQCRSRGPMSTPTSRSAPYRRRPARRRRAPSSSRAGGQRLRGQRGPQSDTLRDARDLFAASAIARDAFGKEVVEHYLNTRVELEPTTRGHGLGALSGLRAPVAAIVLAA